MSVDPPRKRRSSLSGHFQRVFHVDPADKKRRSLVQDSSQSAQLSWVLGNDRPAKSETTAPQSVPDETGISSFIYSSNSHVASLSTPGSTPSVVHFLTKDEESTPQPTIEINNPNADRDKICRSPTWGKENSRKERRATKRLEAERKELEKRLLQLEESQARLDSGNYDRNSRRLTKKNPPPSSERSSSAGSSRGRLRSSSITAFFTSSRRASRSRASSANSATDKQNERGPPGPPSVPLALPERFGADVSRELANRHGTTLINASQLSTPKFPGSQSQSPQPSLQRSLHSTMKSDDLRENWRMAEAWKNGNDSRNLSSESLARKLEVLAGAQSRNHSHIALNLTGSDRDLVAANSKHDRKLPKTRKPIGGSLDVEKPSHQPISMIPKKSTPSDNKQVLHDPAATRITTARQLRDLSNAVPETNQSSRSTNDIQSLTSLLDSISSNIPRKSPPEENQSPSRKGNSPMQKDQAQVPQPLRIGKSSPEDPRERNRQSAPARSWGISQYRSGASNNASDIRNQINEENRRSRVIPPAKHPGRRSLDGHAPGTGMNGEHANPPTSMSTSQPYEPQDPQGRTIPTQREALEIRQANGNWNEADHPRPPSSNSSHGASSYDTADEEVLDVPSKSQSHIPAQTRPNAKKLAIPTQDPTIMKNQPLAPPNTRSNPPLSPGGPLSMLRRKPMQKVRPPRSDDVVAKLFVICCQCKYWHDMPSEVYAKLACPERLPSDSRLVRTFSRKNSVRNVIFSSDSNDSRRMPVPLRMNLQNEPGHRANGNPDSQAMGSPTQPTLYRPQCCWCGHSMSKACCQGWSALVHMRERYH